MTGTIIEVALNGPWTRKHQPGIPITVNEIVSQAIACSHAGASVVHFHAYDETTGDQTTEISVIEEIITGIREAVDVLLYPAIRYMSNAEAIQSTSGQHRYNHFSALGERGEVDWLIVDPGSTNLVRYADSKLEAAVVDINNPAAIRYGLDLAAKLGLNPTMAIYEPGYLRLAHHLALRTPMLKTPMYRFMFSEQLTFGFPPRPYALRAYMELYRELDMSAPWMVAGLGTEIGALVDEVIELRGHMRTGLEDYHLGTSKTNVDLVENLANTIKSAGGSVASTSEASRLLA